VMSAAHSLIRFVIITLPSPLRFAREEVVYLWLIVEHGDRTAGRALKA